MITHAALRLAKALCMQVSTTHTVARDRGVALRAFLLRAFSCMLVALLLPLPAQAQTPVVGAIAVDTRWTVANAPYIVSGDVVVQNNAELAIDPGVTIYMEPGASLSVQAGTIKAPGTAALPIKVLSDKTRLAQAAMPGDWKHWTFNPGTVDTRLDHVTFEHGSGLVVKGAAPVLNNTMIRFHQGAAITVDLAASPSGTGNAASGNTLNGIAVPAGDISGNVKWGMRGIPYMVTSGVVSVGASPTVTAMTPDTLQAGQTATVMLEGTRLAGLERVRTDNPGVTAQVVAGGTATRASLTVVADASASAGPVALRLLTDAGEARIDKTLTLLRPQPTLSNLAPASLFAGQGPVAVTVNGRDFVAGSTAMVDDVAVPTTFVSTSQLRANVTAPASTGNLVVKVRSPDPFAAGNFFLSNGVTLPVVVAQLTMSPSNATITKGATRTFTVNLPYPAPAGGAVLNVVSSVPSVAAIPATVPVAAGQVSAIFALTAAEIGETTVTVSQVGMRSVAASVSVVPPPTLTLSPASLLLGVGRSAELTVTASVAAPAGGLAVQLSNSAPDTVTVPASVTIAAGARSATVGVTSRAIGNATVRAEFPEFVGASTAVSVRPVSLNLPAGVLVAPNLTRSVPLLLSDPAPQGGLVVALSSSDPAVATVPASVTVPAGDSSINFPLTGVALGSATVDATAAGYQAAALPVTVDAVQIRFGNPVMTSLSLPAEMSQDVVVTISRPAPAGGVTIDLAAGDPALASVSPTSINIPEGQTSGGTVLLRVTGVAKGVTTLSASAQGLASASIPLTVTAKPKLVFSRTSTVVGKGMATYAYEVYVSRQTDGRSYSPAEAVTVTLTSSDPSRAVVPSGAVTIPAGASTAYFFISGVELSDATPVTFDASADGYDVPATKLSTRVIAPELSFDMLDAKRSPESIRDNLYVSFKVPGASNPTLQTAMADMPIELSIVDATPENIVDGFYTAATGGTATVQTVLKRGYSNTYSSGGGYVYVATPSSAGSYKVRASVPGLTSGTSDLVTVSAPELRFSRSSLVVAKGFYTYISEVSLSRMANGTAFSGESDLTVNLTSSDPARVRVPATVTIPANSSSVNFYVTGVELTGDAPVTIDASAAGYLAPPTKLAANVILPTITVQSVTTARAPGSERDNIYLSVSTPGASYSTYQMPIADIPVELSIVEAVPASIVDGFSSAATGGVPVTQLLWSKGRSDTGNVYINSPTAAGSYKVRASLPGITTVDSQLVTVSAPDLKLASGSSAGATVAKGFRTYSSDVRVYRSAGGTTVGTSTPVTVTLTSSDPSRVSVPATVTIPAGSSSVYFFVTGVDLTGATPVTLSASAAGHTNAVDALKVNVIEPQFTLNGLDTKRTPESSRDNFWISTETPGAYYSSSQTAANDIAFDLAIVDASPSGIVEGFYTSATGSSSTTQVILPRALNATSTAAAHVATPSAAGTYKVRASAAGLASATSGTVTVSPPQLSFTRAGVVVGVGLDTYSEDAVVRRSVTGTAFEGTSAVTVELACTSTAVCAVPARVTIPAGQASARFKVSGKAVGATTVTATAVGYEPVQDLAVSVITPQLTLSSLNATKVGAQTGFVTGFEVPGAYYSSSQTATSAITIDLTSSSPWVATVPATVTIPAGSTATSTGRLTGVAPGTTTVTASGTGLRSVTSANVSVTQ